MLNQSNYAGFKKAICPVVNQEAAKLGKSSSVAIAFCNAMTWIARGGSYGYLYLEAMRPYIHAALATW
jgi:hypothetical protein